jgi:hypothetical protein
LIHCGSGKGRRDILMKEGKKQIREIRNKELWEERRKNMDRRQLTKLI